MVFPDDVIYVGWKGRKEETMEIISLRIRTKDEAYGQVMQTVLKRNYPGFMIAWEPVADGSCTDAEPRGAAAETGSWGIDLSLCDQREALEEGEILLVDQPFLENVGEDGTISVTAGPVCLFKYAPAREMIGKILGLCAGRMHRQIFRPPAAGCRIVGVFSGAGGKGCTAVSLALAQLGARLRGDRPLVVPAGQFPRGGACAAAAGQMPLREFVYRTLRAGSLHPGSPEEAQRASRERLARAVSEDAFGTGRFVQPAGENPLYRLKGEEMQTMLRAMTCGEYALLIFDLGNVINEASFTVLRAADRLLLLTDSPEADASLKEYLRTRCGGGILEKIIPVRNRSHVSEKTAVDRFYEDGTGQPAAACFDIPYEPLLDTERGAVFDGVFPLEGGFTDAVEQLLVLLDEEVRAGEPA